MTIAWGLLIQAARRGELPLVQFGCSPQDVARHGVQPVYLATPYSKRTVEDGAWSLFASIDLMLEAAGEVARLKSVGVSAFSPIVLSAAVVHAAVVHDAKHAADPKEFDEHHPLDAAAWLRWCQPFLNVCGAVVVPAIEGWDQSAGIKAEVAFAVQRGVPVFVYAGGVGDGF